METIIPETDSFLKILSDRLEGWFEYMWIGPAEGFLISTVTTNIDPMRVAPISVHFTMTGPDIVEVKLFRSDNWITHGVRREGDTLWWTIKGRDVPWVFVPAQSVPQWAHDAFARGRINLLKDKDSGNATLADGNIPPV